MNKDVINTENIEIEEDFGEEIVEFENSGSGILGKVILTVAVGAAAVAGIAYKNKDKIKQKKIEKAKALLDKENYLVYKSDEVEIREVECSDEDEDAE